MSVDIVVWSLIALAVYLGIGCVFAASFVTRWVNRIDANAEHGTWGFRVLIFPASVALWPLLARRVFGGAGEPREHTPHQDAARGAR